GKQFRGERAMRIVHPAELHTARMPGTLRSTWPIVEALARWISVPVMKNPRPAARRCSNSMRRCSAKLGWPSTVTGAISTASGAQKDTAEAGHTVTPDGGEPTGCEHRHRYPITVPSIVQA